MYLLISILVPGTQYEKSYLSDGTKKVKVEKGVYSIVAKENSTKNP